MAISILNNIASLSAENQLSITQKNLQKTLFELSSGSRINSGADDAAGLAIANGLQANVTALNQSVMNSNSGVGQLQVADGALAQVTTLLNRAVTLATESSNGSVSDTQRTALQAEYAQITAEIDQIGSTTNYNGTAVFTNAQQSIFLSDGASNSTINTTTGALSSAGLGLQAMTAPETVPAVQATATVSFTSSAANAGGPANGDTLTVGGTAYKIISGAFDAAATSAAGTVEVKIGSNPSATAANLVAAVNGGAGAGTAYVYSTNGAGSAANTDASAVANGSNVTFTAASAHAGAAGNAIALSQGVGNTSGNLLVPSAFTGGVNQTTPTVQTYNDLSHAVDAQATLGLINDAIATVAGMRGTIGADINRLQAASNVMTVQVQNLTSAEDGIMAADIPTAVSKLAQFTILNQSGISSLAQANSAQQSVLKLLQ